MITPIRVGLVVTAVGIGAVLGWQALVITNITDSLPRGYYIRNVFDASPDVGDIVMFRLPANMRQYFGQTTWNEWFAKPQNGMLKTVVATHKDTACDISDIFTVNGRTLGAIRYDMPNAIAIPHIDGCITLAYNEVMVATNAEKSIDSRYFGAIRVEDCTVYVPLWTWQ